MQVRERLVELEAMCDFLTSSVAEVLHRIAWPLGLGALALILIEGIWPNKADAIEDYLDLLSTRYKHPVEVLRSKREDLPISMSISLVVSIMVCIWISDFIVTEATIGPLFSYIIIFVFVLLFVWLGILQIFRLIAAIISRLDNWTDERALGAFGVILALIAFSFESYRYGTSLCGN